MRKISILISSSAILLCGCSDKLNRRQASQQIDEMIKASPAWMKLGDRVPGLTLSATEREPSAYFRLVDQYDERGNISSKTLLVHALQSLDYVHVQEGGPKTIYMGPVKLTYAKSQQITFTEKAGKREQFEDEVTYSAGFRCYPPPDFGQCNVPKLIEQGNGYRITGIVQDETHATVSVLVPWKLTAFGLQLKPYAASPTPQGTGSNSVSDTSESLNPWDSFLDTRSASGESPATILFVKFDDGWRLVDENGKTITNHK